MIVVGLDTSGEDLLLGLATDGEIAAARRIPAHRRHAELLPGVILGLLNEHRLALGEVSGFAIVSGPGSYTGLRVGAATVIGLTRDPEIPTAALSSFEYWRRLYHTVDRPLCCLIPCRGPLYYCCTFPLGQTIPGPVEILSIPEILSSRREPLRVVGPKVEELRQTTDPSGPDLEIISGPPDDAGGRLARWGAEKIAAGDIIDWDAWRPDYGPAPGFRQWSPPPR